MQQRIGILVIAAATLLFIRPGILPSQTLNPAYLSEMPAPARVTAGIRGKDAEDTGERQMGAFMALIKMMDDMAWGLQHRYVNDADTRALTPDERRLRLAYQTAYAELWKTVSNKEGHVYDHDRDLLNELLGKFFSENFRELYFKSNANAAAGYKAFHDRMYPDPAKTPSSQPARTQPSTGGGPGSSAELRRCIASGRAMRICYSESMGNGFDQLIGVNTKPAVPPGLRMTGQYASADGFRVIFEPEHATLLCRGVPGPRPYTVKIMDAQVQVTIENETGPVRLSLRPDGTLAGSGPIKVTGQVPTGSHNEQTMGATTQTSTRTRELTPLEAQSYPNARDEATRNGQLYTVKEQTTETGYGPTGTRRVTDFTTRTAACTVGLLNPAGPTPLPMLKNDFDILTTIGAGVGALMKGGNVQDATKEMLSPGTPVAPGLRLSGSYTSGSGFSLTFHPESVTLGCGEAEQALEYVVRRNGSATTLAIKDIATPIPLQLMPDGSITSEGTVQVNGRVITGTTEDINSPFVFQPRVARCTVGRLVLGGSAASGAPASANARPVSLPAPDTGSHASAPGAAPNAPTSGTSLKITAGPGVAKLLAGKLLMVLKESLEDILGTAGVGAQGTGSRVSAWARACERSPRDPVCQQGIGSLAGYMVARASFDQDGTAGFNNIPTLGTFYVVADTSYAHHLIWNLRIDLKPGANSILLDEQNTTKIDR